MIDPKPRWYDQWWAQPYVAGALLAVIQWGPVVLYLIWTR